MSVMHMWITLSWKNGVDGNNGGLKDYESVKIVRMWQQPIDR